jgi:hypothetical protein
LAATLICLGLASACWQSTAVAQTRKLATGVLKTIPTEMDPRDTLSLPVAMPGVETKSWKPQTIAVEKTLQGQSGQVQLFRDPVWEMEFSFLGLRQAKLKHPTADGQLGNKNVWYLVYRIRNTGKTLSYKKVKQNPGFDHIKRDLVKNAPLDSDQIDFLPRFVLEGWVEDNSGQYVKAKYPAIIDPVALSQIQEIEDPNRKLLDTYQISRAKIPFAKTDADPGVWGVAIWENINPNIDYVSVFASGLTNAARLKDPVKKTSQAKTLQLNFWRPGDSVAERRDDVSYGIPLVDTPQQQIEIARRYNLPGPMLRGYSVNEVAKRELLVAETEANLSLTDFNSPLTKALDGSKIPPALAAAFTKAGISTEGAAVKTVIPGRKWNFTAGEQNYVVRMEPQFWEPDFGKIRFIKTLDYMWIYR